jgi:hypothetical protein
VNFTAEYAEIAEDICGLGMRKKNPVVGFIAHSWDQYPPAFSSIFLCSAYSALSAVRSSISIRSSHGLQFG